MSKPPPTEFDRAMMSQCIALSRSSAAVNEYPYGAIITRNGEVVSSSTNRVRQDGDVTRHAEVVAISAAQKALGSVSLDDCTLYANAEPCVFCSYAIRESRIGRVVFGLQSPHMGGLSRWNVLADESLSQAMPEVFAPPPEVVVGFMAADAERALIDWNPLVAKILRARGLFVGTPSFDLNAKAARPAWRRVRERIMRVLRRHFFDRFGRR